MELRSPKRIHFCAGRARNGYVYVCIYIYIYITYIHTYIHTHTGTYTYIFPCTIPLACTEAVKTLLDTKNRITATLQRLQRTLSAALRDGLQLETSLGTSEVAKKTKGLGRKFWVWGLGFTVLGLRFRAKV